MGMGALAAVMLRLPLTAVLLATLVLFSDGLAVMPLVIVAVAVAYLTSLRIAPPSWPLPGTPATTAATQAPAAPARPVQQAERDHAGLPGGRPAHRTAG
jgi:hypothetical protein